MFRLSLLMIVVSAAPLAAGDERLICCGAEEVFILPADVETPSVDDRLWRWTAADSPEIPEEHRQRFRTTDECKPYGDWILITSSSQGVALVRREDKACLFFTLVANAHSACLLPGERIAVAASTGGDELLVFDQNKPGANARPLARRKLLGAHGAWWNAKDENLWALGSQELVQLKLVGSGAETKLEDAAQWQLPTPGGHDLSPSRDGEALIVTTNSNVYRFALETGKFTKYAQLAERKGVKSVDEHARLDRTVFHQAAEPNWWSDRIRFAGSDRTLRLAGERLYKVRWDVPQAVPK
jgi:hypothetical protein